MKMKPAFLTPCGQCHSYTFHVWTSFVMPLILTTIVGIGFTGNVLVIIVVLFCQEMRNTTNILLLVRRTAGLRAEYP